MTASLHVSLLRQNTKHAYSCRAATLSTKIAGAGNELKYSYFGPYWISHSLAFTLKQCFHPCIYFPENELWIHTLLKLGSTLWMLWRDAHCTCICVRKCDHISYHNIHTYVRMCMHARRRTHTHTRKHTLEYHTHTPTLNDMHACMQHTSKCRDTYTNRHGTLFPTPSSGQEYVNSFVGWFAIRKNCCLQGSTGPQLPPASSHKSPDVHNMIVPFPDSLGTPFSYISPAVPLQPGSPLTPVARSLSGATQLRRCSEVQERNRGEKGPMRNRTPLTSTDCVVCGCKNMFELWSYSQNGQLNATNATTATNAILIWWFGQAQWAKAFGQFTLEVSCNLL